VAKEDGEAEEDGNEENVGRRGGQSTDEEDPGIGLEIGQAGEGKQEGNILTVTISCRATRVVSGIPRMVATLPRRDRHSIVAQGTAEKDNDGQRDQNLYSQLVNQSRFSGP
jgi:hypothetical protein